MTKPTFGSLFAGVGGIDIGFEAAGWEGKFQVEWDPHCQQTLAYHWPDVPRWGDVSDVSGADLPPVDLITFGSPCQDLSTAGKRAGLVEGSRSNLFFQATRIIKEMRDATANTFPRWALWENVPGAFSSNQGADFGAVLDEMADLGAVAIEWHCLDAQFFGVPQRRRRVFVLACFDLGITKRGRQQVLPVPEGRRGDSAARRQARQDAARAAEGRPSGVGRQDAQGWDGQGTGLIGGLNAVDYKWVQNQQVEENKLILEYAPEDETAPVAFQPGQVLRQDQKLSDIVPTLRAQGKSGDNEPHVLVNEEVAVYVKGRRAHTVDDYETWDERDVAPTLNVADNRSDSRSTVLILDGTRVDDVRVYEEPVQTLLGRMGTGGNQVPFIATETILFDGDRRVGARVYDDGVAPTLMAFMGTGGNNVPMVATEPPLPVLMRQREGKPGGGKGPLLSTDLAPSLVGSNELVLFAPAGDASGEDVCDICSEQVTYCTCWRCMACERLFHESVESTEDADGEQVCIPCSQQSSTQSETGEAFLFQQNQRDEVRIMPGVAGALLSDLGSKNQNYVAQPMLAIPIQDGREIEKHQNGLGIGEEGDPSYTLDQTGGQAVAQEVIAFEPGALSRGLSGDRWSTDVAPTLRAHMGDNHPAVVYPIQGTIVGRSETSGPQGLGVGEPGDPMYTLDLVSQHHVAHEVYAFPSTFSNNTVSNETFPTLTVGSSVGISSPPAVAYPENETRAYRLDPLSSNSMKSSNPVSGCNEVDIAPTLDTWRPDPSLNQGGLAIVQSMPSDGDEEMTLPISHAALRGGGLALTPSPDGNGGESIRHPGFGLGEDGDPMFSLTTTPPAVATTEKDTPMTDTPQPKLVVRRLTPVECERLMGWPDNHTLYRADGKENSDSTRYKMCGNGVASPVAEWIARHILKAQEKMDADRSPE